MSSKLSVRVGGVVMGGGAPVVVQSMVKTDSHKTEEVIKEIRELEQSGCEVVRIAVPDMDVAKKIAYIKKNTKIPLVADIHFDYRLALESIKQGVDKVRINPGNIGERWKVKEVVRAARDHGIPIRIGLNSGSLPKDIIKKYGRESPHGFLEAMKREVEFLEEYGFRNIVLSAKSPYPEVVIETYKLLAKAFPYPLHLGVTEAGLALSSAVRSTVAFYELLKNGIGDTIRVSSAGKSSIEVEIAYEILLSLNLRKDYPYLIVCPGCGRKEIEVEELAEKVRKNIRGLRKNLKIAVMGCPVNGPGEAQDSDIGIAGGKITVLFKKGKMVAKGNEEEMLNLMLSLIKEL